VQVIKRTSCTILPKCQDKFLHAAVLFRKNVGFDHWKAGGEPHAWSSSPSIASSASILSSILRGLGNSRFSIGFVSIRSEESLESLDEREMMLNAPDTRRDVNEGMTVIGLEKRGVVVRVKRNRAIQVPISTFSDRIID